MRKKPLRTRIKSYLVLPDFKLSTKTIILKFPDLLDNAQLSAKRLIPVRNYGKTSQQELSGYNNLPTNTSFDFILYIRAV